MTAGARWSRNVLLKWVLVAIAGIGIAGFLFAWSGIYNVAASRGHSAITDWLLRFGMRNSVELRAKGIAPPPSLDNPDLVTLGAGHFHLGCAFCHGSPVSPVNPITDKMLPLPPNLSISMRPWTDEELFWIVQNGIKYTGMPGWVAIERDDEIWAMVAFLKRLQTLDTDGYRALAFGRTSSRTRLDDATADRSVARRIAICARCHGAENGGPTTALAPRLHGQSEAFLAEALRNYAKGLRPSGIMQPVAADLDEQEIKQLAAYYAQLAPPPKPPALAADNAGSARGRTIATEGDAANGVPPCITCHGDHALAIYPRLDGQSAAYMAGQLRVWKAGHNAGTGGGAIMAPIAQRLGDRDIEAVSAYFASLPARAPAVESP